MPQVSVVGTGYLGLTHAVCLADLGHEVLAIDVDEQKIAQPSNSGSTSSRQSAASTDWMWLSSLLVWPAKSMSIVGRLTGALQAVKRRAPFRMNLSANGDLANR